MLQLEHPRGPGLFIRSLLASMITLWIVDVVANLGVAHQLFLRRAPTARLADYGGLFVAEAQTAFGITVVSGLVAWFLRRRFRAANVVVTAQSVQLAVVVQAASTRTIWDTTLHAGVFVAVIAVGLVVWMLARGMIRARREKRWTTGEITAVLVCTALTVGLVNRALEERSELRLFALSLAGVAGLAVVWFTVRRAPRPGRTLVAWLPPVFAVFLVVTASTSAARYGRAVPRGNAAPVSDRPNIVWIVLDTVRADHLEAYGYHRNTMPNLETWARGAVVFERAASASGWTAPSHASMLSGLPVSLHGLHSSATAGAAFASEPFEGVPWLPGRLRREGYYCMAVVANLYAVPGAAVPEFDRVLTRSRHAWVFSTIAALVDDWSPLMQRVNERLRWRMPFADAREIVALTKRALPDGAGPLFLLLNFMDAHAPYNPRPSALRALAIDPGHPFSRYWRSREFARRWRDLLPHERQVVGDLYDGEMFDLDRELGPLLEWLDTRLGDNTIVIVTSDHGEELGEAGRVGHEYGIGQPLLHVPLFIRAPGLSPQRVETVVTIRRLYEFVDHVARGGEPDATVLEERDGFGVISERYPSAGSVRTFGPAYARPWVAIFEGRFKGVGPSDGGFELYDVVSSGFDNPVEVTETEVSSRLRDVIDAYWEEYRDDREGKPPPLSEEELKRLRALGYVD